MTSNGTFAQFKTTHGASIHRIPLEVFPGFWAYVYLVEHNELRVLIDCGSATETSHANLLEGLSQAGSQPQDLTHILLTHAHIDHYGGLAKLRLLTSAKLGVHELDVQTVSHHQARLAQMSRRLASFLANTGLAEETREQLLSIYRMTKAFHHSVPVDFTYEAENMHLGEFEFVHLPGHCPGHIAIRLHDVVFCGDMVVAGVTPHLTPESIMAYSGLDHYLQSLDRFQEWGREARVVLNGHDDVITDLPGAISAMHQNIVRRVSSAVAALSKPLTVAETCAAVYGEIAGYTGLLTIEKTGAYMEYLYEHGMIEITNPDDVEQGGPARYRRLRNEHAMLRELERMISLDPGTHVHT